MSSTKLIFLDIDGVLNTSNPKLSKHCVMTEGGYLEKDKILLLNELMRNTGADVVISSTWRKMFTCDELDKILTELGFVGKIVGKTKEVHHGCRGIEIDDYCREHEPDNYIILDDDSDMLLCQASHFFNTDHEFGLTKKIVYKASRFLNNIKAWQSLSS